jgi:ABC-type phosphate transport system substrate-binding protein
MIRLLAWLCPAAALLAADIAGSDLLAPPLSTGLRQVAPAGKTIDLAGTLAARRGLAGGQVECALLLGRPDEAPPEAPAGGELIPFPFARAAAVVAVHRSNPTEQISLGSLGGILARESAAPLGNWNELPGGGRNDLFTPAVHSPEGSFVRELVRGLALAQAPYKESVRLEIPPFQVKETLTSVSGALVLLPYPLAGDAKLLQVSDGRPGRSLTAYTPTEMNIYNGDYPLSLPITLYVRKDRLVVYAPVARWVLSEEVAVKLRERGLTPTPPALRARLLQRLDTR